MTLTEKLFLPSSSILASPETYTFKRIFARKYLKNLFMRHNPLLKPEQFEISSAISLSKEFRTNWNSFLGLQNSDKTSAPCFPGSFILNMIDLLNQSGISLSKAVHLKSSVIIHNLNLLQINSLITTTQNVNKIQTGKNGFILGLSIDMFINEQLFRSQQEDFYIRNSHLKFENTNSPVFDCTHLIRHIKTRKALLYLSVSAPPKPLTIKKEMPLKYAHISGDYNFFNCTRTGAKLIGQPEAILPGPGVQSLCWQLLENTLDKKLLNIDIIFAKPAYAGQTYALWHDDRSFELIDHTFNLIAFGSFSI